MKRKLGEILIDLGAIDEHQLQSALEHQKRFKNKLKLGSSLVALGFLTEEKLTHVLSRYLNIPLVNLSLEFITPDIIELVPIDIAERFQLVPFKIFEENRKKILGLAMADPTNLEPIDTVQFSTSLNIRPYVAAPSDVDRAIQKYYHGVLLDGISYVGPRVQPGGTEEKVKIISKGEEITWHGGKLNEAEKTPAKVDLENTAKVSTQSRVATSTTSNNDQMSEMLKLLREQNALMKVLIKKGIVSEEEVDQELKDRS